MGRVSRQVPYLLPEKLKIIREALGLSQGGMLKHLGLGEEDGLFRSSISGYELGTRIPPYNVILAYAKAANIFVDVLLEDDTKLPNEIPSPIKSEGINTKTN